MKKQVSWNLISVPVNTGKQDFETICLSHSFSETSRATVFMSHTIVTYVALSERTEFKVISVHIGHVTS
jgi:hypothetical protein